MPPTTLFDIHTIYLMTGFTSLVAAGILLWVRRDHGESGPSLTFFAAAVLALGAGFTWFAMRYQIPWQIAPTLGYAAFGAASVLLWLASAQMYGSRVPARRAMLALAIYLVVLVLPHQAMPAHTLARISLSSVFTIAFLAFAAREAHRSPWCSQLRAVRLMRAMLLFVIVVIAVRMFAFLLGNIPLNSDGSAPYGAFRLVVALIFGAMPFAITVSVLSIANSQLSSRLERLATTDDLTGLVSRRSLYDSAEGMLSATGGEGCIALLMIDLDDFKVVNDRHGHRIGDRVLCHVADMLRSSLRPDSLIGRYGGDEFCALVPVQSEAAAFIVAERLRAAMEQTPCQIDSKPITVTTSIGVTVHRSGASLLQLLDEADRRAYRAKAQGRNRVVADDPLTRT